jgi:hypothetical protein
MRYLPYLIALMILLPTSCSKNSSQSEDDTIEDPFRYNYPNYNDGRMSFRHTFYKECDDREYWDNLYRSKEFFSGESLYILISEQIGLRQEVPHLTLQEEATIVCSNGDSEKVIFDSPYPPCVTHIQDFILRFGSFPSRGGVLNLNNGFVDVQQDTVQVIVHYKSYWTGNIVTDTAYVSP